MAATRIHFLVEILCSVFSAVTLAADASLITTATLSSMAPHYDTDASLAVDGSTNQDFYAGSCVATAYQSDPWLRIDLGRDQIVKTVTIYTLASNLYYVNFMHRGADERNYQPYPGVWSLDECINNCRQDSTCRQALKGDHLWQGNNCYRLPYGGKKLDDHHQFIEEKDSSLPNLLITVSDSVSGSGETCWSEQNVTPSNQSVMSTCVTPTRGRYVTVSVPGAERLLALCEVQISTTVYPPYPTVKAVTFESVSLAWSPCHLGSNDGQLSDTYKLRYRTTDGGDIWRALNVTSNKHTVPDLHYNSEYVFQTFCYWTDTSGTLRLSEMYGEVTVKTPCIKPDAVVIDNVNSSKAGDEKNPSATLTVTWQPVQDSNSGCERISHYRLKYRQPPDWWVEDASARIEQTTTPISHTFHDLLPYTAYAVQVVAYNNVYNVSLSEEKPITTAEAWSSAVVSVTIQSNPYHINITWRTPATPRGIISHYLVSHRLDEIKACQGSSAHDWSEEKEVMQLYHTIDDLRPFRSYSIRIAPVNGAGRGVESVTTASTPAAEPAGRPSAVVVTGKSSRSLSLAWSPVSCDQISGVFVSHSVLLRGVQYDMQVQNRTDLVTAAWTAQNLVPYAVYSFQVAAVNDVTRSAFSDVIYARLEEDVPPAVSSVSIIEARTTSLWIEWTPPYPPHGIISEYEIIAWRSDSADVGQNHTTPDNGTTITLHDLKSVQNYSVQVRGRTGAGWGALSDVIYGFTDEGVPEEPTQYTVTARYTDALALTWGEPLIANGVILGYKVSCNNNGGHHRESETDALSVTVDELQPAQRYSCALAAQTKKGFGTEANVSAWTKPKKPVTPRAPSVDTSLITDTTITISLPVHSTGDPVSAYQIIVNKTSQKNMRRRRRDISDQLTGCSDDVSKRDVYITAELSPGDAGSLFVVGDNKTYGSYVNCPLQTGQTYALLYGAVIRSDGGDEEVSYIQLDGSFTVKAVPPTVLPPTDTIIGAILGTFFACAIAASVIGILIYRKRLSKPQNELKNHANPDLQIDEFIPVAQAPAEHVIADDDNDDSTTEEETAFYENEIRDRPIPVQSLSKHIAQMAKKQNKLFVNEYKSLPQGLTQNHTVGSRPVNKSKNRFGNIIAYDETRVKLDVLNDDPDSDYINACYINAYNIPAKFIASQGPTKYMIDDFWRMLWEQNVKRVVMLTNVMEKGARKCEQYWPEEGQRKQFGDIEVTLYEENVRADFIIRTMRMSKAGVSKSVWQFHFTVWPDHGVPKQAASLLNFHHKIAAYDNLATGPVVVHCSAGVGRTGAFISLNILLDEAREEQQVNFRSCLEKLRAQRVNMVQTLDQYIFVHNAVNEALHAGDTSCPAHEFADRYHVIMADDAAELRRQFEALCKLKKPVDERSTEAALTPENIDKNRSLDILPAALHRPFLSSLVGPGNDYINALYISGYREKDAYIVTQLPLRSTIIDFWRLLYEHKSYTVIMLDEIDDSDTSCQPYWPLDESEPFDFHPITVSLIKTEQNPEYVERTVELKFQDKFKEETRIIKIFQLISWPPGAAVPACTAKFIYLLDHVDQWQQEVKNARTTVLCFDGAGRSGLFVAASYALEKLKLEQEVDIYSAVCQVQVNRPQFVNSLDQYRFCHDLVLEYLSSMDTYANFQ